MDVSLSGKYAWLYHIVLAIFHDRVKSSVEAALGAALASATVAYGNAALATLPLQQPVLNGTAVLDYTLVGSPSFGPGMHLGARFRAEVFAPDGRRSGLPPPSLPSGPGIACPRSACIHVALPYVFDAAAWSLQATGKLATVVRNGDLPGSFPVHLDTKSLRLFVPALYKLYPDLPVELRLAATAPPRLRLEPAARSGVAQADGLLLSVDVRLANGRRPPGWLSLVWPAQSPSSPGSGDPTPPCSTPASAAHS